jgi:hypothetical protein
MPRPEVELRGRLAALEGERRLVLERLQRVEATVLTQAQAAAQAAVQEAHLRGVLGALPTRMASMSPAERATLLRACVDEIVVQSDGMLTITGVLPSAEAIQPTVELSPGCPIQETIPRPPVRFLSRYAHLPADGRWEGRGTPPARLRATPISLADASRVPGPGQGLRISVGGPPRPFDPSVSPSTVRTIRGTSGRVGAARKPRRPGWAAG